MAAAATMGPVRGVPWVNPLAGLGGRVDDAVLLYHETAAAAASIFARLPPSVQAPQPSEWTFFSPFHATSRESVNKTKSLPSASGPANSRQRADQVVQIQGFADQPVGAELFYLVE